MSKKRGSRSLTERCILFSFETDLAWFPVNRPRNTQTAELLTPSGRPRIANFEHAGSADSAPGPLPHALKMRRLAPSPQNPSGRDVLAIPQRPGISLRSQVPRTPPVDRRQPKSQPGPLSENRPP
jgi:hypothetical protein